MSIIISSNGRNAKKIDKSNFDKEDYLQNYIHQNPESIPVYEIKEDKRLFVVAREFSTESRPIDALAIDKDGDIYIVETKLYKNPDKRTVVAQALDYGASLWRHSDYNEFINKINSAINNKFKMSFEEKIKEFFNINETQYKMVEKIFKFCEQHANKTGKIIDSKTGAILPKEYVLSVDMAKELAMVENSDIGKKVKKHFPTRKCFLFFTAKLPPLTGE